MLLIDDIGKPDLVETSSIESNEQSSVAIIGCGPGGMFFLHALACRRQKLENEGDFDGISKLPIVTCYEKSYSPGGVWRACGDNDDSPNMYEGLWINSAKEEQEFFDYTFDEHFKCPKPAYQPRGEILNYMLKRVTSIEDIFKNVKFNSDVTSVCYDNTRELFDVTAINKETGEKKTLSYDKCIWAGGMNGEINVPEDVKEILQNQCFNGHIFHSSQMNTFGEQVNGKRILMVGDNYSAEDLALQLIKLGVEKIYVVTRKSGGIVSYVRSWPGDKVEMVFDRIISGVTQDRKGLICSSVKSNDDCDEIEIPDIYSVIFCTGYKPAMNFLSHDLRSWYGERYNYTWSVPEGWKSKKNVMTPTLGDVEPSGVLKASEYVIDGIYQNHLISNPNMMFILESSSYPLLEIDIIAWSLLAYVCGDVTLPSIEKIERFKMSQRLEEMEIPYLRYSLDENYAAACKNIDKNHWYHDCSAETYFEYLKEFYVYENLRLARLMIIGNYPLSFGTESKLNDVGNKSIQMVLEDCAARYCLDPNDPQKSWKTFRDHKPSSFSSLITGTCATPLKGRWMDLDDNGNCQIISSN